MKALQDCFDANRRWAARMREQDPGFFEHLRDQQHPDLLWIGCSDSRLPPDRIIGKQPGEVFVHRNVSEPTPRFWEVFFEVYEPLPRQGPGNRACAARALDLCRRLPSSPTVLDLGCGVGGQTLHLAALTHGSFVGIDRNTPSIERLQATLAERELSERVRPVVGDMANPGLPSEGFDLI